jgi:hypothetical protein
MYQIVVCCAARYMLQQLVLSFPGMGEHPLPDGAKGLA